MGFETIEREHTRTMRGTDLLLRHCRPERAPAIERLASELGPELTRRLVAELGSQVKAGARGSRSR
jgi:hypothetical protein